MSRYQEDVLATAKFTATSKDEKYTIVLTLERSHCFDYRNRHALGYDVYDENDKHIMEQGFDARYDHRFNTVDSFNKYAIEFVRDQLRPDLVVERVD